MRAIDPAVFECSNKNDINTRLNYYHFTKIIFKIIILNYDN